MVISLVIKEEKLAKLELNFNRYFNLRNKTSNDYERFLGYTFVIKLSKCWD